jgi:hypothetical protein
MAAHWPRALIRAALREAGYDALAAPNLEEALSYPAREAGRGTVRLIILDHAVIEPDRDSRLCHLLARHPEALTLVLQSAFGPSFTRAWPHILRHPVTIAEIVRTTEQLLPLPATSGQPID